VESNNALAQAVADICEGGVIYLVAGEYTENFIKIATTNGQVLKRVIKEEIYFEFRKGSDTSKVSDP